MNDTHKNLPRPIRNEEPIPFTDNRASVQPVSEVVADLNPPAPRPPQRDPANICPIQRTVSAVVIQQPVMTFNPQTRKPEQGVQTSLQFVADDNHEWTWQEDAIQTEDGQLRSGFYCRWCREWRQ